MTNEQRKTLLKVVAGAVLGLLVLDRVILTPGIARWQGQSERVAALRKEVDQGRLLLSREASIRQRWADYQNGDLPRDVAEAENDLFKAVARWARDSRIVFTGLSPQWRSYEEGYETLDCRASATGDQASISRFLLELERDPMAVRLESCEMTGKDAQGRQLTLAIRFSALRLAAQDRKP